MATNDQNSSLTPVAKAAELQIFDPRNALKDCIITFAFPKSRSANFPIALGLAKTATVYGEQSIEGRMLYWAGFTLSPNDISAAAELFRLAGGWVGTIARIHGHHVSNPFNVSLTLSCYQEALQCSNRAAHCHKMIDDPFHEDYDPYMQTVRDSGCSFSGDSDYLERIESVKTFVFPCKKMLEWSMFHPQFSFNKTHEICSQDQIQAAAVEYGISICPLFDAAAFKEIGSHQRVVHLSLSPKKAIKLKS